MSVPARKPVNQWGVGISFSLRSGIHSAGLPGTRKKKQQWLAECHTRSSKEGMGKRASHACPLHFC